MRFCEETKRRSSWCNLLPCRINSVWKYLFSSPYGKLQFNEFDGKYLHRIRNFGFLQGFCSVLIWGRFSVLSKDAIPNWAKYVVLERLLLFFDVSVLWNVWFFLWYIQHFKQLSYEQVEREHGKFQSSRDHVFTSRKFVLFTFLNQSLAVSCRGPWDGFACYLLHSIIFI